MRKIEYLIIHCTASPDHATNIGVDDVRQWHVKGNGWSDIGYHWLIDKLGFIWPGRPEKTPGAHAKGYNSKSIGIVWVGLHDCNEAQMAALILKGADIVKEFDITIENILGHCELPDVEKTCPNINMTKYRNAVMLQLEGYDYNGK